MAKYPSNNRGRSGKRSGGRLDFLSTPLPNNPVTPVIPGSALPTGVNDNFPGKYWPNPLRVTKRMIRSRLLFLGGLGLLYGALKKEQPVEWYNMGPWRIYANCGAPDVESYNVRGAPAWGQRSNASTPNDSLITGCLGNQANPGLIWGTMAIFTTTRAVIYIPWGDPTGTGVYRGQLTTGFNRATTGTIIPIPSRSDLSLSPVLVDVPPFEFPGEVVNPLAPGKVPSEPMPPGFANLPGFDPVITDPYTGLPVTAPVFTVPGFNPNPGHVVVEVPIPGPGLDPLPLPPVGHPPHLNERPPEGVRERKLRVGGALARIALAAFGAVTEAADFWAAMWKALPKNVRGRYKKFYRDANGLHGVNPKVTVKAKAVLENFDQIDWVKAVGYLLYNQAQDASIGLLGKMGKQHAKEIAEKYGIDIRNSGQPSRLGKPPSVFDVSGLFGR